MTAPYLPSVADLRHSLREAYQRRAVINAAIDESQKALAAHDPLYRELTKTA